MKFLNEMIFPSIQTTYDIDRSNNNFNTYDYRYTFKTIKNNEYSVYFLMTKEEDNTTLNDGTILPNIIIPTILFSETKNGLDPLFFNKLTNYNEFSEVMGKVMYIILDFIKSHNFNIYSIGSVDDKKLKYYNNYINHLNDFNIINGHSVLYGSAYYLIKK